ncbi:MAG TPA: serine protease [Burkholderiaceae bacterium]|nr:serine protease [Burkholderiaceae bacterium]HMY98068.1 serine protease [Burkholderiaceae bacterium]HNB43108.1 serine protease [Burkholderiaceae bacterium]HNG79609.1 serine protease [Burkholderiaceae bacterium]
MQAPESAPETTFLPSGHRVNLLSGCHGAGRGAAALALAVGLALLQACATPSAPSEVTRFAPEHAASLRQSMEARQWSYLGTFVQRTAPSGPGVDNLNFIDSTSVARSGATVRYRAMSIYARPIGAVLATATFMVADCNARTLQTVAMDAYSDEAASVRVSSSNTPGPVLTIQPNTQGQVAWTSVCVGRLATPARPGAATPGAPRAGSGSGVAIAPKLALTNSHVVNSCKTIEVIAAGQRLPATLRKRDAVNDLALLDVAGLPALPYPAWRRQAAVGEAVMAAGFPLSGLLSSDLIVTDGIVNSLAGLGNSTSHLQISAPIQPGNSGGPVIDRGGNVVGVVVSKLNAAASMVLTGDLPQNVNFAIKPEIVGLFLQSEALPLRQAATSGNLDTQQIAAKAREFTVKVECKM